MAIHYEMLLATAVKALDDFLKTKENRSVGQVTQAIALREELIKLYADNREPTAEEVPTLIDRAAELISKRTASQQQEDETSAGFFSTKIRKPGLPKLGAKFATKKAKKSAAALQSAYSFRKLGQDLHDTFIMQLPQDRFKSYLGGERMENAFASIDDAKDYLAQALENSPQIQRAKKGSSSEDLQGDKEASAAVTSAAKAGSEMTDVYMNLSELNEAMERINNLSSIQKYYLSLATVLYNLDWYRNHKLAQAKFPEGYKKNENTQYAHALTELSHKLLALHFHPIVDATTGTIDGNAMLVAMKDAINEILRTASSRENTLASFEELEKMLAEYDNTEQVKTDKFPMLSGLVMALENNTLFTDNNPHFYHIPFNKTYDTVAAEHYIRLHFLSEVRQPYNVFINDNNQDVNTVAINQQQQSATKIVRKLGSYFHKGPQEIDKAIAELNTGHQRWQVNDGEIEIIKLAKSVFDEANNYQLGIGERRSGYEGGRYGQALMSAEQIINAVSSDPHQAAPVVKFGHDS